MVESRRMSAGIINEGFYQLMVYCIDVVGVQDCE